MYLRPSIVKLRRQKKLLENPATNPTGLRLLCTPRGCHSSTDAKPPCVQSQLTEERWINHDVTSIGSHMKNYDIWFPWTSGQKDALFVPPWINDSVFSLSPTMVSQGPVLGARPWYEVWGPSLVHALWWGDMYLYCWGPNRTTNCVSSQTQQVRARWCSVTLKNTTSFLSFYWGCTVERRTASAIGATRVKTCANHTLLGYSRGNVTESIRPRAAAPCVVTISSNETVRGAQLRIYTP